MNELNIVRFTPSLNAVQFYLNGDLNFHVLIVLAFTACYLAIFSQLAKLISPSDIFKLAIVSVLIPQSK